MLYNTTESYANLMGSSNKNDKIAMLLLQYK